MKKRCRVCVGVLWLLVGSLLMLAPPAIQQSAESQNLVVAASRKLTSIDVVHHVGCVLGPDPMRDGQPVNNAALISAALADYDHKCEFVFPGGDLYITEPIVIPEKVGGRIRGSGMSRDLGQGHYATAGIATGQVSQIIADYDTESGDTIDTITSIFKYWGHSWTIEGLALQGRPNPGFAVDPADDTKAKARVGIHVIANSDSGNTGKIFIRDCSFYQIHTHILAGRDMVAANSAGAFTGSNYPHADDVMLENTVHIHPWFNTRYQTGTITIADGVVTGDGTTFPDWAGRQAVLRTVDSDGLVSAAYYHVASRGGDTALTLDDTSVNVASPTAYILEQEACTFRCRTDQSIGHTAAKVQNWGYGNEIFWFERGGRFEATMVNDYVAHGTLLRISYPQINDARFVIHGFDMDRLLNTFQLLHIDRRLFTPAYIELGGIITTDDEITHRVVTARGNANVVLRGLTGGRGLGAGSIYLEGSSTIWSKVHLVDSMIDESDPKDLVEGISTGKRHLKWTNTNKRLDSSTWGTPIDDGSSTFSSGTTIDPEA